MTHTIFPSTFTIVAPEVLPPAPPRLDDRPPPPLEPDEELPEPPDEPDEPDEPEDPDEPPDEPPLEPPLEPPDDPPDDPPEPPLAPPPPRRLDKSDCAMESVLGRLRAGSDRAEMREMVVKRSVRRAVGRIVVLVEL